MKIAVVGTGYVGLVTGVCFAEAGNDVTCIDIDETKIKKLKKGELTIYEPDLDTLFGRSLAEGRLHFTTDLPKGIADAQAIFLALPTPPNGDGSADLSFIIDVAEAISKALKHYSVIINKSTVPVGTAEKVGQVIAENARVDYDVVSNPEFLREGLAVSDFMNPDRIVVGTSSVKARKVMEELYTPFLRGGASLLFMDERSSEMTKYAANTFLAMKISFINEVANLCEETGADVDYVRQGIGTDDRIGKKFLFPGIGYGGSCFPKDVRALHKTAQEHGYDFRILEALYQVNDSQKRRLFLKLKKYFKGNLKGKTFGLWGLSFKPDTDDIREAPAVELIKDLLNAGSKVKAFDPEAGDNVRKIIKNKNFIVEDHQYDALKDVDALLIATEWAVFQSPDFKKMGGLMRNKAIFDGRNLYSPEEIKSHGFHYESIGRKVV